MMTTLHRSIRFWIESGALRSAFTEAGKRRCMPGPSSFWFPVGASLTEPLSYPELLRWQVRLLNAGFDKRERAYR
jgi:hypothetical protein